MNTNQIKLLTKMKELIKSGKCRFEDRDDRNYLNELSELGISVKEAWNIILSLNCHSYYPDPKLNYLKNGESLIFKRKVNGYLTYIKLKIEVYDNNETTVCLSFHKDIM